LSDIGKEHARGLKEDNSSLPENLYQFVVQISARRQILLSLVSVVVFAMSFVPLELQRRIVNMAIETGAFNHLVLLCSAYLAVVMLQVCTKFLMNIMRGRISEDAMRNIRLRVRALIKDKSSDENAGQTVSLVSSEVEPLGGFIGESISSPLVQAGSLITVLSYLTWVEPLMAIVGVFLFLPQFLFVPPMQRAINERAKERIETLRDVGELVVDSSESEDSQAEKESRNFSDLIDLVFKQRLSIFRIKFAMKLLINLLNHLATVGVLFIGGWLVLEGQAEVGTIVAFLSGLQLIGDPGRMLVAFFRQLTDARVRYALIRDFFAEFSRKNNSNPVSGFLTKAKT